MQLQIDCYATKPQAKAELTADACRYATKPQAKAELTANATVDRLLLHQAWCKNEISGGWLLNYEASAAFEIHNNADTHENI